MDLYEGSSMNSMSASEEVRSIVNDYNETLRNATDEIRMLNRNKAQVEKRYEELLATNESILVELKKAVLQKKQLEKDQEDILKANEELFNEAERLYQEESLWGEERELLVSKINEYSEQTTSLRNQLANQNDEQTLAGQHELQEAQNEIEQLKVLVESLQNDNLILKERYSLLEEKNRILMDEELKLKDVGEEVSKLKTQLEAANKKLEVVKKENKSLKTSTIDQAKYDDVLEKNRALAEWRRQLVDKNQSLINENQKLRERCAHLEAVLDDEDLDIQEVLDLIQRIHPTTDNRAGNTQTQTKLIVH